MRLSNLLIFVWASFAYGDRDTLRPYTLTGTEQQSTLFGKRFRKGRSSSEVNESKYSIEEFEEVYVPTQKPWESKGKQSPDKRVNVSESKSVTKAEQRKPESNLKINLKIKSMNMPSDQIVIDQKKVKSVTSKMSKGR